MKISGIIFLSSFIIISCQNTSIKQKDSSLNYLELEQYSIKIGILKNIGGRLVFFSKNRSDNMLFSDSALWNEPDSAKPNLEDFYSFKAYNGHIIWLGPQSDWWTQQDLDTIKRNKKHGWPPDPYLIYGEYEILEHTDTKIVLKSPKSPVSGIQLTKTYEIKADSTLLLEVKGKNISNDTVNWDLWFNTRVNGLQQCFVPASVENMRMEARKTETIDSIDYTFMNGYFTFLPSPPKDSSVPKLAKAFIDPEKPFIATFKNDHCFIIRFKNAEPGEIHPKQAEVEIYNEVNKDEKSNLLELEYHTPYYQLLPGMSMSGSEKWEIYEYKGPKELDNLTHFLDRLPNK